MANNIIGDSDFQRHVREWVIRRDPRAAEYLYKHRLDIPIQFRQCDRKLFMEITVGDSVIDRAFSGRYVFDSPTSWYSNAAAARKSADRKGFVLGRTSDVAYKIMISKPIQVRDVILDVGGLVSFFGAEQLSVLGFDMSAMRTHLQHGEVIVAKGVYITHMDYKIVT